MAFDMIEAMTLVAREKNIEFDAVLETLQESLLAAAKKKFTFTDNISFKFDRKANELLMMATKRVVPFEYPLTLEAMTFATRAPEYDSRAACEALDVRWRPVEETLRDSIRWLAAGGHVPAKLAGSLAR